MLFSVLRGYPYYFYHPMFIWNVLLSEIGNVFEPCLEKSLAQFLGCWTDPWETFEYKKVGSSTWVLTKSLKGFVVDLWLGVDKKILSISVKGKLSLVYSTKVSMENANLHPILTTLCVITFSVPVTKDLFLCHHTSFQRLKWPPANWESVTPLQNWSKYKKVVFKQDMVYMS